MLTAGKRVGVAAALTAAGLFTLTLTGLLVETVVKAFSLSSLVLVLTATIVGELSLLGLGAAALWYGGEEIGVRLPDGNEFLLATAGLVAAVVVQLVIVYVSSLVAAQPADTVSSEGVPPITFVMLIPLSLTVVAFSEEVLFRRVIQKQLLGSLPAALSIGIAAFLFALAHLPTLGFTVSLRSGLTLIQLFLSGVIYGAVYFKSDTILVPVLSHGLLNVLANVSSLAGA